MGNGDLEEARGGFLGATRGDPGHLELLPGYHAKAELLKALAHPVRLCIVRNLIAKRCNVTHMQDCLKIPQSTLSQHLAVLRSRGIILPERVGPETYYKVTSDDAARVALLLVPDAQGDCRKEGKE